MISITELVQNEVLMAQLKDYMESEINMYVIRKVKNGEDTQSLHHAYKIVNSIMANLEVDFGAKKGRNNRGSSSK